MDSSLGTEQESFRRYSPELRLLPWAVWDPIGAEVPPDEYDSYVPIIWSLLAERAEVDEIATQLGKIADERRCGGRGTERAAAEQLRQWWYWRFDFPAEFEART